MRLQKYRKRLFVTGVVLCLALAACASGKQEVNKPQNTEVHSSEDTPETTPGITETADKEEEVEPVWVPVAKIDLTGDGVDESVFAGEVMESGEYKGIYVTGQSESGEVSLAVPEKITILCHQESKTEFDISCSNISLGRTTLAEEPAYGVLGKYLEKTLGMKKSGDLYEIDVNCDTFSIIEAENHKGSAFLCKGTLPVEEKLLDVSWTLEYSLDKWMVTSVELPLWNITGTTTGWETTRGEWSEMVKRNRYMGYLDESACFQYVDSKQDFDGDGTLDRIWRDVSDGESYSIHFGNGEELLITDDFNGTHIECVVWQMTEDKAVFWFKEAGMSTGGDWCKLYLYEQTEAGLVRMELPEKPALRAEVATEREIEFYWREQEPVGTLSLDSVSCFAEWTVEEWLEEYTEEENGAYIFQLYDYDTCFMAEGSVPERGAIRWNAYIGDKWGKATFTWVTEYIDGAWEITDVFLPLHAGM